MIPFRIMLTVPISLAFLLASVACNSKKPVEKQVLELRKSNCEQGLNEVISSIRTQLISLKETTNIDEAESLGVELGQAYEAYPCEFFDEAIRIDLTDKQIANVISILPTELVDKPCESEKKLQLRLHSLDKLQFSEERLSAVRQFLQNSLDRDKNMCLDNPKKIEAKKKPE